MATNRATTLPTDPKDRKEYPVGTGVLDYFPDALAALAHVSFCGNQQHNPGQPLHWAREKSTDQADTLIRHFLQRGSLDSDGLRHSAKMAWRALALLQEEIEADVPITVNAAPSKEWNTEDAYTRNRDACKKAGDDCLDALSRHLAREEKTQRGQYTSTVATRMP